MPWLWVCEIFLFLDYCIGPDRWDTLFKLSGKFDTKSWLSLSETCHKNMSPVTLPTFCLKIIHCILFGVLFYDLEICRNNSLIIWLWMPEAEQSVSRILFQQRHNRNFCASQIFGQILKPQRRYCWIVNYTVMKNIRIAFGPLKMSKMSKWKYGDSVCQVRVFKVGWMPDPLEPLCTLSEQSVWGINVLNVHNSNQFQQSWILLDTHNFDQKILV